MSEEKLEFENDKLYHYCPMPQYGEEIYEKRLVMTKEIFMECYNKWIKEQSNDQQTCRQNKEI